VAKFSKSGVWDKVPEGNTLIFGDTQISVQRSVGLVEGSHHAETSSIRPVIPIQYRLVADGQTDGHMTTAQAYTALAKYIAQKTNIETKIPTKWPNFDTRLN